MNVRIFNPLPVILSVFLTSCGGDTPSPDVVLPANLQVAIEQSEDDPAQIQVTATAENTNFYRFSFGDGSEYVEQTEGKASHTYTSSGTFTVEVSAHATLVDYVTYSEAVVVPEPEPDDSIPATGYTTPETYEGMTLVWRDEFNGESLNTDNWTWEIGGHGWGNNELQYYTESNTILMDGNLIIEARKESKGGKSYTSSRIITQGKQEFQYGRVDIRATLPQGQGIWPALWMLGSDFGTVGWPSSGEIDIMEMIGGSGRENTVYGTAHWSGGGNHASYGDNYKLNSGTFSDEFHVFSIIWKETSIIWYVDDVKYNEIDITPAELDEFQNSFFFIFNVAVGGNWPGDPNESTTFPQRMIVDYIRVFQPN